MTRILTATADPVAGPLTDLLVAWQRGDRVAFEALIDRTYPELRRLAARQLRRELSQPTLQATELVHELYLRLAGGEAPELHDRAHFYAIAARVVRQVLIAHARRKSRLKRGGGGPRISLDDASVAAPQATVELLDLGHAVGRLETIDPVGAQVIELRFFGGLSLDETATVMKLGRATIARKWRSSRAWLRSVLL